MMKRLLGALLALLIALVGPAYARADDVVVPQDVAPHVFERDALPSAPEGFVRREIGEVVWDYPAAAADVAEELIATLATEWPRLERELGADVDDALVVRIARNPDEMLALAPAAAPPPAYAVGVAYPAAGLVLLTLSAPQTWERPALPQVFTHELSHVALHRAVGGATIPRWFTEGVAIQQASERSFERMQTLWEATVRGTLLPLDGLSRRFPSRPHQVGLAYAQSADFVDWLLRRSEGQFPAFLGRLRRGQEFEVAVSQTWSAGIGQLEYEWREGLRERFGVVPLLLGTGAVWAVVALLVVAAWWRRRRDARRTLARWGREEHLADVLARQARMAELAAQLDDEPSDDDEDEPLARTPTHDPHVPTVRWDGRQHTLH